MTARQRFWLPSVDNAERSMFVGSAKARHEHEAVAHPKVEYCAQNCDTEPKPPRWWRRVCRRTTRNPQRVRHEVTWRIHPVPDPRPGANEGCITELVSCCTCCAWPSCRGEGFVARLQRESYDGRDIRIERLVEGRWTNFEVKF